MNTIHKFTVSEGTLETVKATLPLVAAAGTDFTKHFYARLFKEHPELMNIFNQTNQAKGGQPKKLLQTVALAAQAAIDTGELPAEAIMSICQKHTALNISPDAYAIVGQHILGTIEDLLTDDKAVLDAWGALYGDIVKAFVTEEEKIRDEMMNTPGGWIGKREFKLVRKETLSTTITRFKFEPVDGKPTPVFKPGKYTTIWAKIDSEGPYGHYTEQPRHYTLALPHNPENMTNSMSISVRKQGLVSSLLHDSPEGSTFELSAPFGCFDLSGVEKLWLAEEDAPVVFLSAGVGITPVLAMLENIYVTRPSSWLHSASYGSVHAYRNRIREIAAVRNGQLKRRVWYSRPTPEDGPAGGDEEDPIKYNLAKYHYRGRMDLLSVEKELPSEMLQLDKEKAQYYMCGPPGFMAGQKKALMSLGVDESRIHSEGF